MQSINNILVALADTDDAPYVLEKVQILAEASAATVHIVRVIYEGVAELSTSAIEDSTKLKTFISLEKEPSSTGRVSRSWVSMVRFNCYLKMETWWRSPMVPCGRVTRKLGDWQSFSFHDPAI